MSITIKESGYYRDDKGAKRGPLKGDGYFDVWWEAGKGNVLDPEWRSDGTAIMGGVDLVAEWADEPVITKRCDLGRHVRGSNDICIVCGATPEQVNAQAKAAMITVMGRASRLASRLAADYWEKTGRGDPANATVTAQMLKDYPGPTIAEALTNERKNTHGDWTDQAIVGVMLDQAVQDSTGYGNLAAYQRKAVDMILVKVSRIVSGDPSHEDHWDDIAGYAYLGKSGHKST